MQPVVRRSLILLVSALIGALTAAIAGYIWLGPPGGGGAAVSGKVKSYGTANIGGAFTLTDQHGNTRTDKDFHSRYTLIFFGYTHCPDFCPTGLQMITTALDELGDKAANVTPVFISVDPARDTVEGLKEYATLFHPRLVALTGSPEQIKTAAKAYKVFYAKVGKDEDYLMDHSTFTYLMGPDGKYRAAFRHGTDPKRIADRIRKLLAGES